MIDYFRRVWINAWAIMLMILSWVLVSLLWRKNKGPFVTAKNEFFVSIKCLLNISFAIIMIIIMFGCQSNVDTVIPVSTINSSYKYSDNVMGKTLKVTLSVKSRKKYL